MSQESADAGVIIINWHDYKSTSQCITAVNEAAKIPTEIIVVDNESDPKQRYKLEDKNCSLVINEDNRGFAGGCNDGLEKAAELGIEKVCFLNNDTQPRKGFLRPIIEELDDPNVGAAGGIIFHRNSSKVWFSGGKWNPRFVRAAHSQNRPKERLETEWLTGCLLASRRKQLEKIGGFDERYFLYLEDVDLSRRLTAKGKRLVVNPDSIIDHDVGGSLDEEGGPSRARAYYVARNRLLFAYFRMDGTELFTAIAGASLLSLIWAVKLKMSGKSNLSHDIFKGIYDGLRGKWGHTDGYP